MGKASNEPSYTPVTVSGISTAIQVSAGRFYTCATLAEGTVQCWGAGGYGQLGNGIDYEFVFGGESNPVAVSGITTAIQVSTGDDHACALLREGSVQC